MTEKAKKKKFSVEKDESIEECLERMEKEGYVPIRRMEEPIFKETKRNDRIEIEPCGRFICFEGKLL